MWHFQAVVHAESFLANVEVHTSATGSEGSTQVEGYSYAVKSNSERVADCGATPCSASSLLQLWVIESEVASKFDVLGSRLGVKLSFIGCTDFSQVMVKSAILECESVGSPRIF